LKAKEGFLIILPCQKILSNWSQS